MAILSKIKNEFAPILKARIVDKFYYIRFRMAMKELDKEVRKENPKLFDNCIDFWYEVTKKW